MNVSKVLNLSAAAKTWNGLDVLSLGWNNTSDSYGVGIFLNGKCYVDGNVMFYHPGTTFWTWTASLNGILCEEAVMKALGIGEITAGATFNIEVRTYGDLTAEGNIDQSKYAVSSISFTVPTTFTSSVPQVTYGKGKKK